MAKATISALTSLENQTTAVQTINENFASLSDNLDKQLSRETVSPNTMLSILDMNSFPIINLPEPTSLLEPVRLQDLQEAVFGEGFSLVPGDDTVSTIALKDGAVTEPKLADGSVSTNKLQDGSVSTNKLQTGSVTEQNLEADLLLEITKPLLADLTSSTLPASTERCSVLEREAGKGGGGIWKRYASEPSLPAPAKTQDASGAWFGLDTEAKVITPAQLGAYSKIVVSDECRTVFNAMATKPTPDHLKLMDWLITTLRGQGIWDKLGWFMGMCGHTSVDSMLNWKDPTTGMFTGTASFVVGEGFAVDGSGTGQLTTGAYNLTDVPNFALNDAHLGVLTTENAAKDHSYILGSSGSHSTAIVPQNPAGEATAKLNSDTTMSFTHDIGTRGHFCATRNSSTTINLFGNGGVLEREAEPSTGVSTSSIKVSAHAIGTVAFAHAGAYLNDYEVRVLGVILAEYQEKVKGLVNQGTPVTAADLDLSIDLDDNTAALQAFFDLAVGDIKGVMDGDTYLVNDQIVILDRPNIQGVANNTTIRADATMTNDKTVVLHGDMTRQVLGGCITGLTVDYNLDRDGHTTGSSGEDYEQNAITFLNILNGRYVDIAGLNGHKHAVDLTSTDYNRSGVTGTYNTPHTIACTGGWYENIFGAGGGDDCVTTHGTVNIYGDRWHGEFGRATYTGNSNGVELDDFCDGFFVHNLTARFCSSIEFKGHGDAVPAKNIKIDSVRLQHGAQVIMRHIDTDPNDSGSAPGSVVWSDMDCHIGLVEISDPVIFAPNGESVEAACHRVYGTTGVTIDHLKVTSGLSFDTVGAGDEIVGYIWGADDVSIGRVEIKGFDQADEGVQISTSAGLNFNFGHVRIIDSCTNNGIEVGSVTGRRVVVGSYDLEGVSGDNGIWGTAAQVKVGPGFVTGFTDGVDLI